jgi:large subunit ribosomal protein L9
MKVLLIEDVENLGLAGEVHEVANGYGRNYLIPQQLAVLATSAAMKEAEHHRRRAAERRARMAAEMEALLGRISQTTLTFYAKAGEKGRLYGSVTSSDIAEQLAEAVEAEIDRRKIILDAPIKQVGTHEVMIRFAPEEEARFDVNVEPIESTEEEGQAASEPAASEAETPKAETSEVEAAEAETAEVEA